MQFSIGSDKQLQEIENHLANNQYLSGADKPNHVDAIIFKQLKEKKMIPEQTKYPNLFAWVGWLNMFNPAKVDEWAKSQKQEKQEKQQKKEDDVDLFGSEDDENEKEKEALRKKIADEHNAKKLAKGKVECAKTIFIFDVKVYELEQDLDKLANKIRTELIMDGLVWSKDHKLIDVAYGMKKLQISAVVEDAKVCSDDIIDKIQSWEDEVQSVDIASMQKV